MSRSGTSGASAPRGSLSPEERRTERSIALVRIAVVAVVADVYLISIGIRPAVRPLAPSVLVLAAVYAIWSLLARPDETMSPNRFQAPTLLVDATLITLWLVATGGTARATAGLVERIGGKVVGIAFLMELGFLNGRQQLDGYDLFTLISY